VFLEASKGATLRPPVLSDLELIRRAKLGDVEAFAAIYDRHAATVLALGKRILASLGDAQDVLHDVFLEAWQSVRDYDSERASVRTWLLVRMRSRALDRIGRRALEQRVQHSLPPSAAALDADAAQPDRRFAVRQALAQLDAALRSSLELIYFGGFTAAEAAQHMNVPEGTVRSRVARGLLALEQALTESKGVNPHVE
jgi:RNA polymerase sigma-70 factor (ECF subfamily)